MRIFNSQYIIQNVVTIHDIIHIAGKSNKLTIGKLTNKYKYPISNITNKYYYCIYLIINYNNNTTYIGNTTNIYSRMCDHIKYGNKSSNNYNPNSIYYTMKKIHVYILPIHNTDKIILNNTEKYIITTTSPSNNIRYNTRPNNANYITTKPIIIYNTITNTKYIYKNTIAASNATNIPIYKFRNKITNIHIYNISYTNTNIRFNTKHNGRQFKYSPKSTTNFNIKYYTNYI